MLRIWEKVNKWYQELAQTFSQVVFWAISPLRIRLAHLLTSPLALAYFISLRSWLTDSSEQIRFAHLLTSAFSLSVFYPLATLVAYYLEKANSLSSFVY